MNDVTIVIVICSAVGGIAAAYAIIKRWILGGVRAVRKFFRIQAAAGELIDAQLRTNHGSTLLDIINNIPGRIDELANLITENHEEARRKWRHLEDEVGELKQVRDRLEKSLPQSVELLHSVDQRIKEVERRLLHPDGGASA